MVFGLRGRVPVTVNDVLDGHVKLDVECLDRFYTVTWVRSRRAGR